MREQDVRKIGFFGYEYTDIAWYLARMYAYAGKQVVVVDMTDSKKVMTSLCMLKREELPEEMIEKGIRLVKGESFKEDDSTDVECIIYCFGYDRSGVCTNDMTDIVLVTDVMQSNAEQLSLLDVTGHENVWVIVRDMIYLKYGVETLVNLIGVKYDGNKVFELPYEEVDYRSRCYMCIDKNSKLAKLSPSMRDVLMRMYTSFFGSVDKKVLKDILRKA